jgi:hypothetical protein
MRKICLAALGALSLSAFAQGAGEQLFLLPPQGWTVAKHDVRNNTEFSALLPPGQTAQNWTEMITVELINGKPAMDVQTTLNARLDLINQGCDDVGAGPPQLSVENGYETGVRAFACPKTKKFGKGELSLYKVIIGRNRTYVVSRAWSGEPFQKDKLPLPAKTTEEWLGFMSKILVCEPGERTHPCPQAK